MLPERSPEFDDIRKVGFTLVEVLLALILTAVVAAAIYKTLGSQQKAYNLQNQVITMQQNLRLASDIMAREIAMAGYHPPNCTAYAPPADSGHIVQATATQFRFTFDTMDNTGDPLSDCDVFDREDINYYLDGSDLRRKIRFFEGGEEKENTAILASNIVGMEFCYVLNSGSQTATPSSYSDIRAIEISILIRSEYKDPDPEYRNKETYAAHCGTVWGPFNDQYRRKLGTTTVWCRNLGL